MPATLAGGRQIDMPCFTDLTQPDKDRTPTPQSDIQAFLARNEMFRCEAHSATIRPEQCAINRGKGNYLCGKCIQAYPGRPAAEVKRLARRQQVGQPLPPQVNPQPDTPEFRRDRFGRKVGTCPSCKRPGQKFFGKMCSRCRKRIANGHDVNDPDHRCR